MDPIDIIKRYYDRDSKAYQILVTHGRQVAGKARQAAEVVNHLSPDMDLIERAAMLHDIGMVKTNVPKLGCHGEAPYIKHGVFGRQMLDGIGLSADALICERHVGAGITAEEICCRNLPLPKRDMVPVTIEEQIICYADKFFSKSHELSTTAKSLSTIINGLSHYGPDQVSRFKAWDEMFSS